MPLYEYRCSKCGHEDEHIATMDDRYKVACTRCGGRLELRMSLSHFRMAIPFYILDGQGNIMDKRPDSESAEPPTPPEKAHWLKEHANRVEV